MIFLQKTHTQNMRISTGRNCRFTSWTPVTRYAQLSIVWCKSYFYRNVIHVFCQNNVITIKSRKCTAHWTTAKTYRIHFDVGRLFCIKNFFQNEINELLVGCFVPKSPPAAVKNNNWNFCCQRSISWFLELVRCTFLLEWQAFSYLVIWTIKRLWGTINWECALAGGQRPPAVFALGRRLHGGV